MWLFVAAAVVARRRAAAGASPPVHLATVGDGAFPAELLIWLVALPLTALFVLILIKALFDASGRYPDKTKQM
jgi:hypothetical protein